jgi:hypothetical protein
LSLKETLLHFVVPVTFWAHDHVSAPSVVKVAAAGVGDDPPVVAVPDVQDAATTIAAASAAVQRRGPANIDLISLSTRRPRCLE